MSDKKIIIRTTERTDLICCKDIVFCKADGSYSNIYLFKGDVVVASRSLKWLMEKIDVPYIIRISQSILVNINFIQFIHHKDKTLKLYDGNCLHYSLKLKELEGQINDGLGYLG